MCPTGQALGHPAAQLLQEYADMGCPVRTGRPWTREMMDEAVQRGPHQSALTPEALEHFAAEAKAKVDKGQAKLVYWDDIKDNPPPVLGRDYVWDLRYRYTVDVAIKLEMKL